MKICPNCRKIYEDDSLNYCLDDGVHLNQQRNSGEQYSEPTLVMRQPDSTKPDRPFITDVAAQPVGIYNAQPKTRSKSWLWVVGILGVLATLCGGGFLATAAWYFSYFSSPSEQPLTDTPSPRSTPGASPTPWRNSSTEDEYDISMAKYNQLSIGMARSEVERILGGKGTEISSSTGGGMSFSVNKWEG